jgi:hypothetical protein
MFANFVGAGCDSSKSDERVDKNDFQSTIK